MTKLLVDQALPQKFVPAIPQTGKPNFGLVVAMDYDGSGNLVYYGRAVAGSPKASAAWQIRKFTYSGANVTDMQWADGTNYSQVWDNRASLSYS